MKQDKEVFLGKMMAWCFKWGCEVSLRNKAMNFAPMDPIRDANAVGGYHERMPDGTLVDMAHRTNHKVIEVPELVFTRGDRHFSIVGHSWEDLIQRFKYSHQRIYMDLSVPALPRGIFEEMK